MRVGWILVASSGKMPSRFREMRLSYPLALYGRSSAFETLLRQSAIRRKCKDYLCVDRPYCGWRFCPVCGMQSLAVREGFADIGATAVHLGRPGSDAQPPGFPENPGPSRNPTLND